MRRLTVRSASLCSFYCSRVNGSIECTHERGRSLNQARCFVYKDKGTPWNEQLSIIPRNQTDAVDWYRVPTDIDTTWRNGPTKDFK